MMTRQTSFASNRELEVILDNFQSPSWAPTFLLLGHWGVHPLFRVVYDIPRRINNPVINPLEN